MKRKRIEQSTLALFQNRPWKKKMEEEEKEDETEDTCIRLVQPTDELLGLIGDDDNSPDEAIT